MLERRIRNFNLDQTKKILSLIDLTSLNETDTTTNIADLCKKAVTDFGSVAAVCVYPKFVKQVKQALEGTSVKIATVVNFPSGNQTLTLVLSMIKQAIADGANEIDVVLPYTQYLAGDRAYARDFIQSCKNVCDKTILLKVILETGALQNSKMIAEASMDAIAAGADFLKTSTGKIAIGATLEAAKEMLLAIKQTKRPVGLKISGGVRTLPQALQYIELAEEVMGKGWVSPTTFRLGASQLVEEVFSPIS